jgi:bifunctional non-homologous end joining protein LigD
MLATLTNWRFSDPNWVFETKFDGERCLAFRNGGSVRLFSRNRKPLTDTYPEIADAIGSQALHSFVVDGEIVAFEGKVTRFSRLQRRTTDRSCRGTQDWSRGLLLHLLRRPVRRRL